MKRALITGIAGQDGSYLAELLLSNGYEVHGIIRRSSSFNTGRIDPFFSRLKLHYGDLTDAGRVGELVREIAPNEIYNLGAQSHVRVSFDMPAYTAETVAIGTSHLLEAARRLDPMPRFYQASSSEQYGRVLEIPQTERTPFNPRSPYACAKVHAHFLAVNYREAYGLPVSCGILFNHECVSERTPLIVRRSGLVDVLPAVELVPLLRKGRNIQQFTVPSLEIWDGEQWTPVLGITATKRRWSDPEHKMLSIEARSGCVETTAHHTMVGHDKSTLKAMDVKAGHHLAMASRFPEAPGHSVLTPEMAEFLGLMSAEGYVSGRHGRFTNKDDALIERTRFLWTRLFLGTTSIFIGKSGFPPFGAVTHLNLTGNAAVFDWLRQELYTRDGFKRVPQLILNATPEIQGHFLRGHYAGDGLKAGGGDSVKTNSEVLAQGLYWLYSAQGRNGSVYIEHRNGNSYYAINLPTASPCGNKGAHLRKSPSEVRRVITGHDSEWVFDLATGSGVFVAGVGRLIVHNSPRRGETFVTRKITRAVGRIKHGLQNDLALGNLDARRDWGHAADYVEAMWRMLQADKATDYVIATGREHTVREFVDAAFAHVGLDWARYVRHDPRLERPTEVDLLLGNAAKARSELGWFPRVSFNELVREMVEADCRLASREALLAAV